MICSVVTSMLSCWIWRGFAQLLRIRRSHNILLDLWTHLSSIWKSINLWYCFKIWISKCLLIAYWFIVNRLFLISYYKWILLRHWLNWIRYFIWVFLAWGFSKQFWYKLLFRDHQLRWSASFVGIGTLVIYYVIESLLSRTVLTI